MEKELKEQWVAYKCYKEKGKEVQIYLIGDKWQRYCKTKQEAIARMEKDRKASKNRTIEIGHSGLGITIEGPLPETWYRIKKRYVTPWEEILVKDLPVEE